VPGYGRGTLRWVLISGGVRCVEADYRDARGKRCRSVIAGSMADARTILAKLIRERDLELAGMGVDRGLSMRLDELAAEYLADLRTRKARPRSIVEAKAGLERLARDLGARTVRDIRAPLVMAWRDRRVAGGASNKTANTEVGYLKAALALAVRKGHLAAHPLHGLKGLEVTGRHQVRRARTVSDWELGRIFAAADELDREAARKQLPRAPLVRALAMTGARWSELVSATWRDLDAELGALTFRAETTKGNRERTIPLAYALLAEILTLPTKYAAAGVRVTPGMPIFLSPRGQPWARGRQNFYRHIRDVFVRASVAIKDETGRVVHVHALRHTFATRCFKAKLAVPQVQLLTGHRSTRVLLEIYTHLANDEARSAIDSLPSLAVGGSMDPTSEPRALDHGSALPARR
jgi:integrase